MDPWAAALAGTPPVEEPRPVLEAALVQPALVQPALVAG